MGGKGGPSGSQQMKAAAGSQTKGVLRKARKAIMLGKSISIDIPSLLNKNVRTREVGDHQMGLGCQCHQCAVHISGGSFAWY